MAVIEELPDSVKDTNLNNILQKRVEEEYGTSNKDAASSKNNHDTVPELPGHLAEVRNQSVDDFVKSMNKMPFFMTELDETAEDGGENDALEALKALAYEGTPEEVAKNFKQQGNDCFKTKQLKDAREFYTKALAVKCGVDEIDEACLNNRAQCNLEMQNYGKTIRDCRDALKINPRNEKSWFRCAKALLALDRLVEAEACIDNALTLMPSHAQVKEVHEKIKKRREYVEGLEKSRHERERRQKSEKLNIEVALKGRNIRTKTTPTPPDLPDGVAIKLENPSDPTSTLLFPTILLYPLTGQSDFVTEFPENGTLDEQLSEILAMPPDWDKNKEYIASLVNAYMETHTGGLIKVGKKAVLLEALSSDKVEVSDQLVRILIVPRARNKEFIEDWKNRMNK